MTYNFYMTLYLHGSRLDYNILCLFNIYVY